MLKESKDKRLEQLLRLPRWLDRDQDPPPLWPAETPLPPSGRSPTEEAVLQTNLAFGGSIPASLFEGCCTSTGQQEPSRRTSSRLEVGKQLQMDRVEGPISGAAIDAPVRNLQLTAAEEPLEKKDLSSTKNTDEA